MGTSKVVFGGETVIDLTSDTVTPETLAEGITAHGANGERIVGTLVTEIAEIPSYIKTEARRVINAVVNAQNVNTITFLAMTDAHQWNTHEDITTGNRHAGLGAKIIAQAIDLDFAVFLGDYTWGASTTTIETGKAEIRTVNENIREAFSNVPNFRAVGNHDSLLYSHGQNGDYLKPSQLYEMIGKYNEGATVDSNNPKRGYCYRDFEDKCLRVILLNTADGEETGTVSETWKERISGPQMAWFANAMDLSGKTNASSWKIIVLSHHPLDWGTVNFATKVIDAYVGGKNLNFTHGTTTVSKNYSGKNAAKFIGNFHGHVHGFKTDKLHLVTDGVGVAIDKTLRVATPNSCFGRNNEYGENGTTEYWGIEFGEAESYDKTAGTAQDTAFVVYVVDTVEESIQAIHYGAGYDRVIGYGEVPPVVYNVVHNLTHVSSNNNIETVVEGNAFTATLTASNGYVLDTVTVTMGGVDITATAYSGGVVNITSVTGDIVITAIAEVIPVNYTNVLATAQAYGSTAVYNGVGYMDGKYLSTGATPYEGTDSAFFLTGYIPYVPSQKKPIYIKGATWTEDSHSRMNFFNANKTIIGTYIYGGAGTASKMSTYFTVETLGSNYIKLAPTSTSLGADAASVVYFRMSLKGKGAGVIITIDEPIE